MTPKAVFWDMDGTLIDSEPLHARSLEAALRSLDIEPPGDLHARVVGVAAGPVFEMLRDELGLQLTFQDWIARKYSHYMAHLHELQPREGALEIFAELEQMGVAQVIVSNSDRKVVDTNMRVLGIDRPAIRSISRNDVRQAKPEPEPYLRAAFLIGVDPGNCAVVEDSVAGATAGVEAGMQTYLWVQENYLPLPGAVLLSTANELRRHLGLPEV